MSRQWWIGCATIGAFAFAVPVSAQATNEPPERIDILVSPEDLEAPLEDCSREQEAAIISGEIIVCRRRRNDSGQGYDAERAEREYAARTMNEGNPQAPDLFGIPDHGVVVARGCFIPPCPPPPALIIDIEALPEAPPGSDADRISRGLKPLGAESPRPAGPSIRERELGLPAPEDVNPPGSASPEEEPSG